VSLSIVQRAELLLAKRFVELPEKQVQSRVGDAGRLTQAPICWLLLENRVAARQRGYLRVAATDGYGKN
jgi:hypothetical protein